MTAETTTPKKEATFIAVLRPHRIGDVPEGGVVMAEDQVIHIPLSDGKLEVVVDEKLRAEKMNKNGEVVAAFGRVF